MAPGWVVLHGGALGDLVLTLQLALRLPSIQQGGRLHVVSRTDPGELSACRPRITRQSADALGCHWLYLENGVPRPSGLDELLRDARVLSALGDIHCRAHERLLAFESACVYSFDPRPRPGLNRHITQQWLLDLEAQGLLIPKCTHQHPEQRGLGVPNELRARGAAILQTAGADTLYASAANSPTADTGRQRANCILIHPGSGAHEKCWPLPNFLAVARALHQAGAPLCFLLGPAELERRQPAELRQICDNFPVLREPLPDDLLAVLAAARSLVANDSGPAHLAALLGTPTVTIFGPTPPVVWRPLGPGAATITGDPQNYPSDWNVGHRQVADLATRL